MVKLRFYTAATAVRFCHRVPMKNRDKAKEPRGRGLWCFKCDAAIVSPQRKCPVCGARNGKKRFKAGKATPQIQEQLEYDMTFTS